MKNKHQLDPEMSYYLDTMAGERKSKKFFKIAIPILVIEIIALIGLAAYFFVLPKNYCKISINMTDAVIYVNNKQTKKFRMDNPKEQNNYYFYGVDVSVMLPKDEEYLVTFTLKCDKYSISPTTSATLTWDGYSLSVSGGQKTQLISGITIISREMIRDFNVAIAINVEKL